MAAQVKTLFRARAIDANKPMTVFYASELPEGDEAAPIARAVAQMPTGMEKEEEMESHLQDAILAQQASTSGVSVENHVIPTPKVFAINDKLYDEVYPKQPSPLNGHYLKVQAWLSLDHEEPEYDVDSEDEVYLSERPHIEPRVLERIFDTLEAQSSDNNICWPETARALLTAFDESVVDDVYDYWLSKRQKAMQLRTFNLGVGGLIPKIRNECRKDASGTVNPYVAFRRRAEKMQTRKNRKNDEESYEKVLKLSYDLRKSVTLFDMVKRREKTKMVMMDLDSQLLNLRCKLDDDGANLYNHYIARLGIADPSALSTTPLKSSIPYANGITMSKVDSDYEASTPKAKKQQQQRKRKLRPHTTTGLDREVPNKAWLKKNAEVWNRPPSVFSPTSIISPVVEVDRSAQMASEENLDGRYTFKRRRGCVYRAAHPILPLATRPAVQPEQVPRQNHVYKTYLQSVTGPVRLFGMARRRLGRSGRVIVDRLSQPPTHARASAHSLHPSSSAAASVSSQQSSVTSAFSLQAPPLRVPKVFDPFDDEFMEDHNVTFRARPPALTIDEEDDFSSLFSFAQRRRIFVNRFGTSDADAERERSWREQPHDVERKELLQPAHPQATPHSDRPPPSEEEGMAKQTEQMADAHQHAKRRSSSASTDASTKQEEGEEDEPDEADADADDGIARLGGVRDAEERHRGQRHKLIDDQSGNGQTGRVEREKTRMGQEEGGRREQRRGDTTTTRIESPPEHEHRHIKIEDIDLETKGSESGSAGSGSDWREASGSPSESNSSTEWPGHLQQQQGKRSSPSRAHRSFPLPIITTTSSAPTPTTAPPPSLGASIAFVLASEEEARTGEHPVSARHPPIAKQSKLDDCGPTVTTPGSVFLLSATAANPPPVSLT